MPLRRRARSAQTSTETILIVVLVAIACLIAVSTFGYKVQRLWKKDVIALDTGHPPVGGGALTLGNAVNPRSGPIVPRSFPTDGSVTREERFYDQITDMLQYSEEGRSALEFMRANNVQLRLVPGFQAGQFNPPTGPIDIDPDWGPDFDATVLVHEINHARYAFGHLSPDVNTTPRAAYIDAQVQEDAVGQARAIQAKMEMEAAGQSVSGTIPGETSYRTAYTAAIATARAANPNASAADLEAAGRAAGLAAVRADYDNGVMLGSNTVPPKTYGQLWGDYWDSVHGVGGGT